ncbi:MAG TPA: hypothetical protein VE035_11180, partial [Puia sp.]|nr:hypothetical protein [Puia sp.]
MDIVKFLLPDGMQIQWKYSGTSGESAIPCRFFRKRIKLIPDGIGEMKISGVLYFVRPAEAS